ncbi:MAG: cyclic nucleotide-binding domain-containing protein, partial [Bacteroidota bacterium]
MVNLLSLYHQIPATQQHLLSSRIKTSGFKKGDFVLVDGEVQEHLYLVKKGVLILYYDQEDMFKVLDFAYGNRFCADLDSFSNQKPSNYCIQCIQECEVELISIDDLEEIFDAAPDVERAYRILMERILTALLKKSLNQEIMTIQERFKWVIGKHPGCWILQTRGEQRSEEDGLSSCGPSKMIPTAA